MPEFCRSLLFAALLLSACDSRADPEPAGGNAATPKQPDESALALPEVPSPAPELDRAALLAAVARAASAHAAGQDDRQQLNGRRFTLKIRFGCGEAGGTGTGPISWAYDEAEQRLTIRAAPDVDAEAAGFGEEAEGVIEAVEGFWIPQPWLLTDACAAGAGDESEAANAAAPTVAVAHYFTAQDSRLQRRSQRSYEIVRRAEPAIVPPDDGFNLVLQGRLQAWPEGKVIRCRGTGRLTRPVCIVSAEFDRVAFESPANGLTIAQWSAG